jgi:hypothetical protein
VSATHCRPAPFRSMSVPPCASGGFAALSRIEPWSSMNATNEARVDLRGNTGCCFCKLLFCVSARYNCATWPRVPQGLNESFDEVVRLARHVRGPAHRRKHARAWQKVNSPSTHASESRTQRSQWRSWLSSYAGRSTIRIRDIGAMLLSCHGVPAPPHTITAE